MKTSVAQFLIASLMAVAVVNGMRADSIIVQGRRGLILKDEYIALVEGPPGTCITARREIAAIKAKYEKNLKANDVINPRAMQIKEFCAVEFVGPEGARDEVEQLEYVTSVEENQVFNASAVASWGLDRVDQASLPLDNTYTEGYNGAGVNIYVIDTGIRESHADWAGRGKMLSSHVGESGGDKNGHGSHCAGTAAGTKYGVAKAANVFGIKVLNARGSGSSQSVVAGIEAAVRHANTAGKTAVLSLSLGGPGREGDASSKAVAAAAKDHIVVVAAGNDNQDACRFSPAVAGGKGGVITVGATDRNDRRSTFSNFGACVDVFAPGTGITSAWYDGDNSKRTISGTSMACPHVAGLAALFLQKHDGDMAAAKADLMASTVANKVANAGRGSPNKLGQISKLEGSLPPSVSETAAPSPDPTPDNAEWTCKESWYDANDGCDCGCGKRDPDCDKNSLKLFCQGRGAKWHEICSDESQCEPFWGLFSGAEADGQTMSVSEIDEAAQTAPPTYEDNYGKTKFGIEDLTDDVDSTDLTMAIGIPSGVVVLAGVASLVVVKVRNRNREEHTPENHSQVVSGNPSYDNEL